MRARFGGIRFARWQRAFALLASVSLVGIPELASACTQEPPNPPVVIIIPFPGGLFVSFRGYQTFGSIMGARCACAFDVSGTASVGSVLDVEIVTSGTGQPIPGFGSWAPDSTVGANFDALAFSLGESGTSFQGFSTTTAADIEDSAEIEVRFQVTLAPGATRQDLENELLSSGFVIGTGEVDGSGNFINNHETVQPVASIARVPIGEVAGPLVLAALLIGGAVLAMRRRPAPSATA